MCWTYSFTVEVIKKPAFKPMSLFYHSIPKLVKLQLRFEQNCSDTLKKIIKLFQKC